MRKSFFILFAVMMALISVAAVSADQEGHFCWCNTDQYGCWITGETGGNDYIMFWSESTRDYFMGQGSKAPLAPKYFMDKLPLDCGAVKTFASATASGVVSDPAENQNGEDDTPKNPCNLDCGYDAPYYDEGSGTCFCMG